MMFDQILERYKSRKSNPFAISCILDLIPSDSKKFKNQILALLANKINNNDPEDLEFYLAFAHQDGIDKSYKSIFKQLILAKWHSCHEDVVEYIGELKDDDFTDDLYIVATTPDPYRKFDDELEATLRKCVHALKAINSTKSHEKLEQLRITSNPNVRIALDQYR
jgi:hypothetical protein